MRILMNSLLMAWCVGAAFAQARGPNGVNYGDIKQPAASGTEHNPIPARRIKEMTRESERKRPE